MWRKKVDNSIFSSGHIVIPKAYVKQWRLEFLFRDNGKNVETTEKDLKKVWPKDAWNRRHLQIIYFGREYCPARNHDLIKCSICSWAASKKRITQEMKNKN